MTSYTPTLEEMRGWKKRTSPKETWNKDGDGCFNYYSDTDANGWGMLHAGNLTCDNCNLADSDGYCPANWRPPSTTLHSCDEEVEKVKPPPFRMRGYIAHPIKPDPHMNPNRIDSNQYVWDEKIDGNTVDSDYLASDKIEADDPHCGCVDCAHLYTDPDIYCTQ